MKAAASLRGNREKPFRLLMAVWGLSHAQAAHPKCMGGRLVSWLFRPCLVRAGVAFRCAAGWGVWHVVEALAYVLLTVFVYEKPPFSAVCFALDNILAVNVLRNVPVWAAKRAVSSCKMCRFTTQNGTFRNTGLYGMSFLRVQIDVFPGCKC